MKIEGRRKNKNRWTKDEKQKSKTKIGGRKLHYWATILIPSLPPSLQAPGAPRYYTATTDYNPGATDNGVQLTSGQEIEVIGINKYGWWWVRATNRYSNEVEEGWVPASYLQISANQTAPGPDSLVPAHLSPLRKRT